MYEGNKGQNTWSHSLPLTDQLTAAAGAAGLILPVLLKYYTPQFPQYMKELVSVTRTGITLSAIPEKGTLASAGSCSSAHFCRTGPSSFLSSPPVPGAAGSRRCEVRPGGCCCCWPPIRRAVRPPRRAAPPRAAPASPRFRRGAGPVYAAGSAVPGGVKELARPPMPARCPGLAGQVVLNISQL